LIDGFFPVRVPSDTHQFKLAGWAESLRRRDELSKLGKEDPNKFYPPAILKRLYSELQLRSKLKAGEAFDDELKQRLRRETCLEWETIEFCLKKQLTAEERQEKNKVLDTLHERSGMMASVRTYVWRVRPALAPNPSAAASKEPWSRQKNPEVAARMARDGSCTVPQMQDVLAKELRVRKSAVPKWKAQCVEKIFELAKLSTQQATLPALVATAAPATVALPLPNPAADAAAALAAAAAAVSAASAAAAVAVRAEEAAEEQLCAHVERECGVAVAAELEEGDEADAGRGEEPIVLETAEVEGGERSDDEGSADESEEPAGAGDEVSAVAVAALQELVEEAESNPDAVADAILEAPSIWRCCSSGAKTAAWKCGGCNLWTHRSCEARACGGDRANPLCKSCFELAALVACEPTGRRRSGRQ